VELTMLVTRSEDNHLSGTVRSGAETHDFSGMLELMRVFEELVQAEVSATTATSAGLIGDGAAAREPSQPRDQSSA
jgi:hypothetical protein